MAGENTYPIVEFVEDPETGIKLPVEHTSDYSQLIQEFYAEDCKHLETAPMRVLLSTGTVHVRNCCTSCGARLGTTISQKDKRWVETLPWQEDALAGSHKRSRENLRHAMILELARKQYAERGRFTQNYRDYIASDNWKIKRALVLKRCVGRCEGCGVEKATEVHHLHYRHLGNEFLFELLGLCHKCHDRITSEKRSEQGVTEDLDDENLNFDE